MSATGIGVYIPDFREQGERFRESLDSEYDVHFHFVSIGRGAALPAFMADIIAFGESPLGVTSSLVLAAFFAGEKIEKNLDAWQRLFDRLKSTFRHRPTFDREGAAVLVENEIAEKFGRELKSIQCRGLEILERLSLPNPLEPPAPKQVNTIMPPADKVTQSAVYYFEVNANERTFLARVEGHRVVLIELIDTQE